MHPVMSLQVSLSASRDEQEALETERGGALRCWFCLYMILAVPSTLQAFIESVRALGDALTYRELLRSVRYVGSSPHRMELRALLLATT